MKKIAVTGPRQPVSSVEDVVREWVRDLPEGTVFYHGGAKGVDTWAGQEAYRRGLRIVCVRPKYDLYPGHLAPLVRNAHMVEVVDAVHGFWHGLAYGGTLNTLWTFWRINGMRPTWTLIEPLPEEPPIKAATALENFESVCANPPAHWLEAFKLFETSITT